MTSRSWSRIPRSRATVSASTRWRRPSRRRSGRRSRVLRGRLRRRGSTTGDETRGRLPGRKFSRHRRQSISRRARTPKDADHRRAYMRSATTPAAFRAFQLANRAMADQMERREDQRRRPRSERRSSAGGRFSSRSSCSRCRPSSIRVIRIANRRPALVPDRRRKDRGVPWAVRVHRLPPPHRSTGGRRRHGDHALHPAAAHDPAVRARRRVVCACERIRRERGRPRRRADLDRLFVGRDATPNTLDEREGRP